MRYPKRPLNRGNYPDQATFCFGAGSCFVAQSQMAQFQCVNDCKLNRQVRFVVDLCKAAANRTMSRCELKNDVNCDRAPTILGARAYDGNRCSQRLGVAVLLVVMLGTCSALPGKPTGKTTKKETTTAVAMQQERDAGPMEDLFMFRQRLTIMAAGAIAVLVTGYSLWRHQRIAVELEQVSAGADVLQRRLAKLSSERDKDRAQLARQAGENVRLKAENTKLRNERDQWQRTAQEARALAAVKQYSVEDLRKALGSNSEKEA
jgi:regulator of replication initiation timing